MMSEIKQPEGQLFLNSQKHQVEYEPSGQAGLGTLYLRVQGQSTCVPIYHKDIDAVCDLLQRGKQIIFNAEGHDDE